VDQVLRRFAAEHGGVILARDLPKLGYSWRAFKVIADAEGYTRAFRSAYVEPGVELTPTVRARALQRIRPKLVVSHELAAWVYGFAVSRQPRLTFTGRDPSRFDVPDGRLFRWHLRDEDVTEIEGLVITVPERTVVDVLRSQPRDTGVICLDSALSSGAVLLDGIATRLDRLGGDTGVPAAWTGYALADPHAESPTETKARLIMWDRKLYPRSQVVFVLSPAEIYRADFDLDGLIIECEGSKYHGGDQSHESDVRRFNALMNSLDEHRSALRLTWREVFLHSARAGGSIQAAHEAHMRRTRRRSA